jgi:hypothetical protein
MTFAALRFDSQTEAGESSAVPLKMRAWDGP